MSQGFDSALGNPAGQQIAEPQVPCKQWGSTVGSVVGYIHLTNTTTMTGEGESWKPTVYASMLRRKHAGYMIRMLSAGFCRAVVLSLLVGTPRPRTDVTHARPQSIRPQRSQAFRTNHQADWKCMVGHSESNKTWLRALSTILSAERSLHLHCRAVADVLGSSSVR